MIFNVIEGTNSFNTVPVSNAIVWGVFAGVIAVLIALYVLRSIGLYVLAKKAQIGSRYLCFIPLIWIIIACKLAGEVVIFGSKFKRFVIVVSIVFITLEVLNLVYQILYFLPLVGYFLQGGKIYLYMGAKQFSLSGTVAYLGNPNIFCGSDFILPIIYKSQSFLMFVNVIFYITMALEFVNLVLMVSLYSAIFRKYLPGHYFIAMLLSVLGLAPIFLFAVRKNEPKNYAEWMRERYARMYGNSFNNPYNAQNPNNNGDFTGGAPGTPFEEFAEKGEVNPDDPFEEFSDKDNKN